MNWEYCEWDSWILQQNFIFKQPQFNFTMCRKIIPFRIQIIPKAGIIFNYFTTEKTLTTAKASFIFSGTLQLNVFIPKFSYNGQFYTRWIFSKFLRNGVHCPKSECNSNFYCSLLAFQTAPSPCDRNLKCTEHLWPCLTF